MNFRFHSRMRLGLVALGVLAGLAVPAAATPLSGVSLAVVAPAISDAHPETLNVKHRRYRCYDGWCGKRHYRKHRRHHRRHYHVRPRVYFGVPAYRYVQPRRYYRRGGSSAHVRWCYDRYRSYRAWDNTFQPYHGPRRQCWSPYS